MKCPACEYQNRSEARFCGGCGQKLEQACPHCQHTNSRDAKFCDDCGTPLGAQQKPKAEAKPAVDPEARHEEVSRAERRQLTVMFCDMVGSSKLAEQLDPEDLRDLLADYQACCASLVSEFDGHVARYIGDGILVYFGYPKAHEDDARRSVQAALRILEQVPQIGRNLEQPDIHPQVRIGIATGLVVAGDIGSGERHEEMGIVGETPNIAARVQALAAPDSIVIASSTQSLVEGLFELEDLGPQQLRGISESVTAFRVHGESDAPSHFEARASRGLTPMVGREEEIGLLLRRWRQAKEGEASVVVLLGESGVGKSRIVRAFNERLGNDPRSRVLYFCSPFHSNSAYFPLIDQIQRVFRFTKADSVESKLEKLEAVLDELGLSIAEHAGPVAKLLNLPAEERYGTPDATPQQFKRNVLELCLEILRAMCSQDPVLMVLEDAHWADPSMLEMVEFVSEQLRWQRILLVVTARPEFEHASEISANAAVLRLSRLSRKESAAIVSQMLGERELPSGLVARIVEKTDGVPLFVEELTRVLLDSRVLQHERGKLTAGTQLASLDIPASLQDSLMARLDGLKAEAKELAQLAAAIGRSFSHEITLAVSPFSENETEKFLDELAGSGLIVRRSLPPHATYEFKHALIRDVAYESLLRRVRQKYHVLIAKALNQQTPNLAQTEPEILAYHYSEAGLKGEAIEHWKLAGQRAVQRSANLEAIHHFNRALELLSGQVDTRDRALHEIEVLVSLGVPLIAARGWAASEVAGNYQKAITLCERVGETPLSFSALKGAFGFRLMRGELQIAVDYGRRLLVWAEETNDVSHLLEAHLGAGMALFWSGEFRTASEHLQKAGDLYDPLAHESHAYRFGTDPGVARLFYDARNLWHMGYPDEALTRSERALELARDREHPHSLAWAMAFAAALRLFRREWAATLRHAEETVELCTEYGFPFWLAWGTILRDWVLVAEGRGQDGLAEMRQGLAAYRATGAEVARPYFLTLLAEAYGRVGQTEEGLNALEEAIVEARNSQNRCSEAEMHRLRGLLLMRCTSGHKSDPEQCLRTAVETARRQHARSFELRAATDLARYLGQAGHREEAATLMTPLYETFHEGHETADLQDAASLLRDLRQ